MNDLTPELGTGIVAAPGVQVGWAGFNSDDVWESGMDVVDVIRARSRLTPDCAAVIYDGAVISFGDLDRRSDELAVMLHQRGVGPEDIVGILVNRSPHLPVSILAVLKAGAAFLPMDPGYPPHRIGFMLADADVSALLTEERLQKQLTSAGVTLPGVVALVEREWVSADSVDLASIRRDPNRLAYVIYTSGSMGRPKGVMIAMRSLSVFTEEVAERLGLGAGDRFLQFASPGFDVLIEELFPIWSVGGAVVIPARHIISGEDDLAALIERERVTVIELPTAYWHEWVRELHRTDVTLPSSLRLVIIGGERVLPQRLELWRKMRVPLMHVYGLTETAVSSTFFRVDPADPTVEWPNLPIGTGLRSARLRVLDRRLRPVPDGGTGELYIGGISLARGYLGSASLTAQRFVADPGSASSGERLYRTGDIVRRRPDGQLEFVSRADHQLKIRGFRVEPIEIEAVLTRHAGVAECAIDMYEPRPGDRRLVAYFRLATGAVTTTADMRSHLEEELPAYMVPSMFVELDSMPLNANGKIDRAKLPAPQTEQADPSTLASDASSVPHSMEHRLADVIASVVGVAQVGLHDNFFEIGGDSILAIQVVARAQEVGIQLTPYDLFAQPTVAALADVIVGGVTVDAAQGEVTGPVPPLPALRSLGALAPAELRLAHRAIVLELSTSPTPELLARSVARVMEHHDGLRQRILMSGERTRIRIAPVGDPTPFQVLDFTATDGMDETELCEQLAADLDLAIGPLIQVGLLPGGEQPDRLVIVGHEFAVDRLSLQLVLEDLETAMVQQLAGEELRFLPKTTSWQAWARRLSTWIRSDEALAERDYWNALLAAGTTGQLFEKNQKQATGEMGCKTVRTRLSVAESEALTRVVSSTSRCCVEEVLLAALARALHDWTGDQGHLIEVERHDRVHSFADVDITRTVGPFAFSHPFWLEGNSTEPAATTLRRTVEAWRTVPGGGVGWTALAPELSPPSPRSGISFSYRGIRPRAVSGAFRVVAEYDGIQRPSSRPGGVAIVAEQIDGALEVSWSFHNETLQESTVERVTMGFFDEVRGMIADEEPANRAARPSDFPLARVRPDQLADLLRRL